jgi:3-oxoacyl-[acyl-carrier protein] reductase
LDLGLEGKVALVTAASKGLGRAVAGELAREGERVVISSRD